MAIETNATYENGVLKPDGPLALAERQRVHVVIEESTSRVKRNYGLLKWHGRPDDLQALLTDPDLGLWESR